MLTSFSVIKSKIFIIIWIRHWDGISLCINCHRAHFKKNTAASNHTDGNYLWFKWKEGDKIDGTYVIMISISLVSYTIGDHTTTAADAIATTTITTSQVATRIKPFRCKLWSIFLVFRVSGLLLVSSFCHSFHQGTSLILTALAFVSSTASPFWKWKLSCFLAGVIHRTHTFSL